MTSKICSGVIDNIKICTLILIFSKDSSPSLHTKQSSLPSLFLETSFGPNDIGDVTSHGFNSFTLGRIRKKKKSNFVVEDPYVAHTRSQSSTVESDTMDAELVSQVHQKIFHSSSSSSSIIGNLLSSSFNSSGFNRAPPGNSPYSTWTLPRTNRAPKKNLSFRSTKTNTIESIVSAVEDSGDILDFQSSLDNITGIASVITFHSSAPFHPSFWMTLLFLQGNRKRFQLLIKP